MMNRWVSPNDPGPVCCTVTMPNKRPHDDEEYAWPLTTVRHIYRMKWDHLWFSPSNERHSVQVLMLSERGLGNSLLDRKIMGAAYKDSYYYIFKG